MRVIKKKKAGETGPLGRKQRRVQQGARPCNSGKCAGNYFTEMCSGSEAGSYLRLIDFVYHSTLGLSVIKKKKRGAARSQASQL